MDTHSRPSAENRIFEVLPVLRVVWSSTAAGLQIILKDWGRSQNYWWAYYRPSDCSSICPRLNSILERIRPQDYLHIRHSVRSVRWVDSITLDEAGKRVTVIYWAVYRQSPSTSKVYTVSANVDDIVPEPTAPGMLKYLFASVRHYSIITHITLKPRIILVHLENNACLAMPFTLSWLNPSLRIDAINATIRGNHFILAFKSGIARITTLDLSACNYWPMPLFGEPGASHRSSVQRKKAIFEWVHHWRYSWSSGFQI